MSHYLYIDTTKNLTLGLLSSEEGWVSRVVHKDVKSSELLHSEIHEMCIDKGISLKTLSGVLYAAGPGSYTGMRVSEGLAQVFNWQGVPIFGFYHFELPKLFGESEGIWISQAFKGEYFAFNWNGQGETKKLFRKDDLVEYLKNFSNIYTHHHEETELANMFTSELIEKQWDKLLSTVVSDNMRREPYYYRTLEEEFVPSSK